MLRVRAGLALLLTAALLPGAGLAQNDPPLNPEDPPAVVRTGADPNDRVTIPITIDGKGPWHFVIDTGSQRTVISRALADRLALTADTPVRIMSMTGISDAETVTVPRIAFGSTEMADVQAPVLDAAHLGAAGLLGLDGLQKKRLVLNFRTGKMNISSSRSAYRRDADAIVVTARSRFGQLILLHSQAEGQKVNIILDTGAEYSVGNAALLARLAKKRPGKFTGAVTMTSVTGETMTGKWGYIRDISMGNVTLKNLPVVFAEAAPFRELGLTDKPALLLGVNALRGFDRVAIDFGRKQVDFLLPDQGSRATVRLAALGM